MWNVLSVDVEEYFHPAEVQASVHPSEWDSLPVRMETTTKRTLELLEHHQIRATFFVLGWVAQRYPHLVRQIASAGHEIGCHGYAHLLVCEMTPSKFKQDTHLAQRAIEDAADLTPQCYRAPSYSITSHSLWALEILAECGFTHDSSIYPIAHDRYGIPNFYRHACRINTPSGPLLEVPVATAKLSRRRIVPVGGGAYLRLLPYRYTAAGIRRINEIEGQPACIYFHPWEIDPAQPKLIRSRSSRVRTYCGLSKMLDKLHRLLTDFRFTALTAVHRLSSCKTTYSLSDLPGTPH